MRMNEIREKLIHRKNSAIYSLVPGKHSRRGKCAAMDREDFSTNKRSRARQLSYWLRQWNWPLAVDSEMLWIRSIYFGRLRHFVRWPLCKCQQCTSVDGKIVARNLRCTSQGFHFRSQWRAENEDRDRGKSTNWIIDLNQIERRRLRTFIQPHGRLAYTQWMGSFWFREQIMFVKWMCVGGIGLESIVFTMANKRAFMSRTLRLGQLFRQLSLYINTNIHKSIRENTSDEVRSRLHFFFSLSGSLSCVKLQLVAQ